MTPGDLHGLEWHAPAWLGLALVPGALAVLAGHAGAPPGGPYAEPHLLPWVRRVSPAGVMRRMLSRRTAWWLAWALAALAAAGPRVPVPGDGDTDRPGHDLVVALDLSRSMAAADILPSRLRRARLKVESALGRLRPGDRLALVVYAGRAHLLLPLTFDRAIARAQLALIERGLLPTLGSDPGAALAVAADELANEGRASRSVLLVSDGGGLGTPGDALGAALDRLRRLAAPVYVLGAGGPSAAPVPALGGGWVLTAEGRPVASRLDAAALRRVADATGGAYARVGEDEADLDALFAAGLARTDRATPGGGTRWRELYPLALAPALLLFAVALLPAGAAGAVLLVALAAALPAPRAVADTQARAAHAAYTAGDHARALALYAEVPGYPGRMGEGASAYRGGDLGRSVRAFSEAVLAAPGDAERASALFNLGIAYFQAGQYAQAARVYADVELYRPGHRGALANRALAGALAEAVRRAARVREEAAAARAGRGTRAGRRVEAADRPEASLTLGEVSRPEPEAPPLPVLPGIERQAVLDRVTRGLEQLRAHEGDGGPAGGEALDAAYARSPTAPHAVRAADALAVWRRLFEAEEGFPAPVRAPRPLPGVDPW
jgi:Ca-activated chloride channel family protein